MAKRSMSSEKASYVKRQGHKDALEFALLLGLKKDYQNDLRAKKDVIDNSGYSYSVKSGEKKWQIFLYSASRFKNDILFQNFNGLGNLLLDCLNVFPDDRKKYLLNKEYFKMRLADKILNLKNFLEKPAKLKGFISLSFFNGNEVDFLVIKHNNTFHVFSANDVVRILSEKIKIDTSHKRQKGQFDHQKVVFKIQDKTGKLKTIGEIEVRNDSDSHYKELKFWMSKSLCFQSLVDYFNSSQHNVGKEIKNSLISNRIILYGKNTIKKFNNRKNVN